MSHNIQALGEKVEALRAEIVELDAIEAPTEEQAARFDAAITEFDAAKADYDKATERAAKVESVREAVVSGTAKTERAFHAPSVSVKRDVHADMDAVARGYVSPDEMVSRALTAIEETAIRGISDAAKERATELAESDPSIARHILLTGSPAYFSAFKKYLRSPQMFQAMLTPEEADAFARASLSNTAANGGATNPWLLDPTVILTNSGAVNPFRALATIVTGTTDKWNGITSAGVTAEWLGEGSAAADASPTVASPQIPAFKGAAYIDATVEQQGDGQLVSQLPRLIADAKDRLEATAFATGNGTTQPEGVVTGVGAVTASRISPTTGGQFAVAGALVDVFKVANGLSPRSAANASWVGNKTVFNTIRQAAMAQNSANSVWTDGALGTPSSLLGSGTYEASAMDSTYTTSSNILLAGDFKAGYYIYDRVGVEMQYIPVVIDQATGRPNGKSGWFTYWRTGAEVVDPNAFRLLRL